MIFWRIAFVASLARKLAFCLWPGAKAARAECAGGKAALAKRAEGKSSSRWKQAENWTHGIIKMIGFVQ